MRRATVAGLALMLCALTAGAGAAERRFLGDAEAPEFRGVGRLNVYGSRFCTATLIDPNHVLTAAHCLYSPVSGHLVRLHGLVFVAGQRRDRAAADRRVTRMAVLPGFSFGTDADLGTVRRDMALLELDRPVPPSVAAAFPVASSGGETGGVIVSYAKDRPYAPTIEGPCGPRTVTRGVAVLDCAVVSGVSGAPVFVGPPGARRVVGVVSAMARDASGRDVALTVMAPPRIGELRAALAKQSVVSVAQQDAQAAKQKKKNQK